MLIPKYQCLKRDHLSPHTFKEWIEREDTIYISKNLRKYSQNPDLVDEWIVAGLDLKLSKNLISHAEYIRQYELFIRNERWGDLDKLMGKTLGCWCENISRCHASVLRKLVKEKLLERRMVEKYPSYSPSDDEIQPYSQKRLLTEEHLINNCE